jgi:glucoamylase
MLKNPVRGHRGDGYRRGWLWPIFTAERGIYEIARAGQGASGQPYRQALKAFSSQAGFIPEQVWNMTANVTGWETVTPPPYTPGTATRSMQPLSWAMGEYINLVAAMRQGRSDAPAVVCGRYSCDKPQTTVTFQVNAPTKWGESICLVGSGPLLSDWIPESAINLSPTNYPIWSVTVSLPASTTFAYKFLRWDSSGQVVRESGGNRVVTTAASGEAALTDTFR